MSSITLERSDVTSGEVAEALRQGLGPRYTVLPGTGVNWNPVGGPRPDHPDTIVVGTGSNRVQRAEVTLLKLIQDRPDGLAVLPELSERQRLVERIRAVEV